MRGIKRTERRLLEVSPTLHRQRNVETYAGVIQLAWRTITTLIRPVLLPSEDNAISKKDPSLVNKLDVVLSQANVLVIAVSEK